MLTYVLVVVSPTTSPGDSDTSSLALSDVTTHRAVILPARDHHGDFASGLEFRDHFVMIFFHVKNPEKRSSRQKSYAIFIFKDLSQR